MNTFCRFIANVISIKIKTAKAAICIADVINLSPNENCLRKHIDLCISVSVFFKVSTLLTSSFRNVFAYPSY